MYAAAMGIAITRVLVAGTRKVNLYVTMSKYVPISAFQARTGHRRGRQRSVAW